MQNLYLIKYYFLFEFLLETNNDDRDQYIFLLGLIIFGALIPLLHIATLIPF